MAEIGGSSLSLPSVCSFCDRLIGLTLFDLVVHFFFVLDDFITESGSNSHGKYAFLVKFWCLTEQYKTV